MDKAWMARLLASVALGVIMSAAAASADTLSAAGGQILLAQDSGGNDGGDTGGGDTGGTDTGGTDTGGTDTGGTDTGGTDTGGTDTGGTDTGGTDTGGTDTGGTDTGGTDEGGDQQGTAAAGTEGRQSADSGRTVLDLTAEQRLVVRRTLVLEQVDPVQLEVEIGVGTTVPETVTVHPVPEPVTEAVPDVRGYSYFKLADDRIVVVEPGSMRVVEVIE